MKKSTTTANKAKATKVVTTKNVVKTENLAPKKSKQIIYLNSGITGKMMQDAKINTNKEIKKENFSFSFCLKQVLKHDQNFTSSILNFKETDCTPKNLLSLLGEKEAKNGKFSSWLVMQLITRFYKK